MSSNGCEIALYDSVFRGNTASSDGGAMLLVSESELTVIESTFQKNNATGGDGGAIACLGCTLFKVTNSTFEGNTAARGGALRLDTSQDSGGKFDVHSSTFQGNEALQGGGGVLYRVGPSAPRFDNTTLENLEKAASNNARYQQAKTGFASEAVTMSVKLNNTIMSGGTRLVVSNTKAITPPPVVILLDRYGSIVKDESQSLVISAASANSSIAPLLGELNKAIQPGSGEANFLDLTLRGSPFHENSHSIIFSAKIENGGSGALEVQINLTVQKCGEGQWLSRVSALTGYLCENCPQGKYGGDGSLDVKCTKCQHGLYQSDEGKVRCEPAQEGHYVNKLGASNELPCFKGTRSNLTNGSKICVDCQPGQFQSQEGKGGCDSAEAGFFVEGNGAKAPVPCSAGKHSANLIESTSCTKCRPGRYQDKEGNETFTLFSESHAVEGGVQRGHNALFA